MVFLWFTTKIPLNTLQIPVNPMKPPFSYASPMVFPSSINRWDEHVRFTPPLRLDRWICSTILLSCHHVCCIENHMKIILNNSLSSKNQFFIFIFYHFIMLQHLIIYIYIYIKKKHLIHPPTYVFPISAPWPIAIQPSWHRLRWWSSCRAPAYYKRCWFAPPEKPRKMSPTGRNWASLTACISAKSLED